MKAMHNQKKTEASLSPHFPLGKCANRQAFSKTSVGPFI